MKDKFGNPLSVGDTVIYFSTDMYHNAHVGLILEMDGGQVKLRSEKGREIKRGPSTLIHYTGITP